MTDLEKLREEIARACIEPLGYSADVDWERTWVGNNIDDAETGSLAYLCRSLADRILSIPTIADTLRAAMSAASAGSLTAEPSSGCLA